ncbi:MAG: divalent-cation tolerance protein CutA [Cyanobacteria bacterium J06623_7]
MSDSNYGVILVTVASQARAQEMAIALVQAKLAACVNLFPIESIYLWQSEINQDREYQLIIKTDLSKFEALTAKITALHSYKVPEIIALPIVAGSSAYLNWLGSSIE